MPELERAWIRRSDAVQCGGGVPGHDVGSADGTPFVVQLGGELDLASVAAIEPALDALLADAAAHPRDGQVVVDVADLDFLDSSGVGVLIRIANSLGPIRLVNAAPVVRRVVEVLSLGPRLGLEPER